MSAAAKKKAKKKAKEKEKKADGGAKAPKVSAAVRKMQEAQEARLRAEAERRAAEEERIRLVCTWVQGHYSGPNGVDKVRRRMGSCVSRKCDDSQPLRSYFHWRLICSICSSDCCASAIA